MKEVIQKIVDLKEQVENREGYYRKQIRELEGLKNDYTHILELGDLDAIQMMKMSSIFRQKLRERRTAINRLNELKKWGKVFRKHEQFFNDLKSVLGQNSDSEEEKCYYARSELGQILIDEYSKIDDDLVVSPQEEEITELKEVLEGKFNV